MPRISLAVAALLGFAFLPGSFAQHGPVPIEPLLRNSDPRLVALGAWEAFKRQDDTFAPLLVQMVEQWDPEQRHVLDDKDRYLAMMVILDVLIQRNQVVSPAAVTAIAYAFPDQALILISRLPFEDAEPILLSWYHAGAHPPRSQVSENPRNQQMLARVAAMILVTSRPSDIAASLLADTQEQLAVSVPSAGAAGVDRCLVECNPKPPCSPETSTSGEPLLGWPPIFPYAVEENAPFPAELLIAAGGDRITYGRGSAGGCYFPAPLNAANRHRLLAEMLQVSDESLPWTTQMNLTLPWVNDREFQRRLTDEIHFDETRLRATVSALFQKGFLTKSQMEATRPRLTVLVFDDRQWAQPAQPAQSAPRALPIVPTQDPRTTCRLAR